MPERASIAVGIRNEHLIGRTTRPCPGVQRQCTNSLDSGLLGMGFYESHPLAEGAWYNRGDAEGESDGRGFKSHMDH